VDGPDPRPPAVPSVIAGTIPSTHACGEAYEPFADEIAAP